MLSWWQVLKLPSECHITALMDFRKVFVEWYGLPDALPYDVKVLIVEFTFDPLTDPW